MKNITLLPLFFFSIFAFSQTDSTSARSQKLDLKPKLKSESISRKLDMTPKTQAKPTSIKLDMTPRVKTESTTRKLDLNSRQVKNSSPIYAINDVNTNKASTRVLPKSTTKPSYSEPKMVENKETIATKNQKKVDFINHILNGETKNNEVYLQFINKSKCNLIMSINGRKPYTLNVPSNNSNFISVEKGNYSFSSSVCGASYNTSKNVKTDLVITIGSK